MENNDHHDLKEKMNQTFYSIWKHANDTERSYIQKIWSVIIQPAQILSWVSTGTPGEFELRLKEEVLGSHPDIPLGELMLKKSMKISFSEDFIAGSDRYRQVIYFPDRGVSIRIGMGWISKESPLEQIHIEQNQQGQVWCTVNVFGQNMGKSAEETLVFWQKIKWRA